MFLNLSEEFRNMLYKLFAYTILKMMTPDEVIAWRKRNGYTQAMLAKALGVHLMTVSKWERGIHRKEMPPFLALALRALELEGGDERLRETKTRKEER